MQDLNIDLNEINFSKSYRDNVTNVLLIRISKLEFKDLPLSIDVCGECLFLKDEFHLTVIGNNHGERILSFLRDSEVTELEIEMFYKRLLDDVKEIVVQSKFFLENQFYVLKKNYDNSDRVALIQIVNTDLIDKIFRLLKDKYGVILENDAPEPHITLYTQKDNKGIGLYKKGDLRKYVIADAIILNNF